jgi:hypothetical protein
MRITAFIGAAVLGMAMMAFAPAAMALDDPLPDICALDLSPHSTIDNVAVIPDGEDCPSITAAARLDLASLGGDQGEAAPALCVTVQQNAPDFAGYRLHVDPGRCLA